MVLIRVPKNCNDQIPQVKCGDTIQPQSSIQRNDFWFCRTLGYWRLFLAHPTDWNECSTFKDKEHSSRVCFFWVLKVTAKSESWKKPIDNAVPCFPHDDIVGNRLCDECKKSALPLACLSPFCDCSYKVVDRPKNVWSLNSCQVQTCLDNLWVYLWQVSNRLKVLSLVMMTIQARSWHFV